MNVYVITVYPGTDKQFAFSPFTDKDEAIKQAMRLGNALGATCKGNTLGLLGLFPDEPYGGQTAVVTVSEHTANDIERIDYYLKYVQILKDGDINAGQGGI